MTLAVHVITVPMVFLFGLWVGLQMRAPRSGNE